MPDPQSKVREVAWNELFPWLLLVRSIRIALMARVILLGALGLIAVTLGWRLIAWMFSASADPIIARWYAASSQWIWNESREFWIVIAARSAQEVFYSAAEGLLEAPLSIWLFFTRPFLDMFGGDLTPIGFLFLLVCCVWELLVWGLIGGAITRIAALKFTRDEAPGIGPALAHAARKLPSYSLPPLVALAGAAVFAVQLVVFGVIMRVDFLAMLAGIFWPFVLLLGLLMAVLLLGALVGWPLMWATVSVEGTDAFDALSRSYAYTYHRPLRLLWYVLFAAILAVVSMFVVKLFAATAIALGDWSVDWGLDEPTMRAIVAPVESPLDPLDVAPPLDAPLENGEAFADDNVVAVEDDEQHANTSLNIAASAIYFWKSMVAALAAGYQAGFLWVSAVGVYLLLRRDIDGVLTNEVYIDESDDFGLPALADEASGAPEVAPGEPAVPGDS